MIKPQFIVESGVMLGWGSYLMRHAAGPNTHFIYISPHSPKTVSERQNNSPYYTDQGPHTALWDEKFKDFNAVDWDKVGIDTKLKRESTLLYFDDHQSGIRRLVESQKLGFKHIMYDDGYPWPGDNFSLKQTCDKDNSLYKVRASLKDPNFDASTFKNPTTVSYMDNFARTVKSIDMGTKECLYNIMMDYVDIYYEFPPLWVGTFRGQQSDSLYEMYQKPLMSRYDAKNFANKFKKLKVRLEKEAAGYTFFTYVSLNSKKEGTSDKKCLDALLKNINNSLV